MLSQITQVQKNEYYMIPLYEALRVPKIVEPEGRIVFSGDQGEKGMGYYLLLRLLFNGYRVSSLQDEKSSGVGWVVMVVPRYEST